jgi:hypothetical protein
MTNRFSRISAKIAGGTRRAPGRLWLLLGLALLAAGCKSSGPGSQVFVRRGDGRCLRVAVLPFISPANAPGAGDTVTATVVTYLLSTGVVEVVEPGLVDRAMRNARFAPQASGGLDLETLALLQQQLQVDAYLVGAVEEFGEVRVGPDIYPSVSLSARLIRAADATIVWAASISRTGADTVKVFDIGRVSSISKLTMAAVAEMAQSLGACSAVIAAAPLTAPGAHQLPQNGTQMPTLPPSAEARRDWQSPPPGLSALNGIFLDEARSFGVADLKALLPEVPGFKRGQVNYSKHFHDTVTALYGTDGAGIDVKLVDYQKADIAVGFVQKESAGLKEEKIASLTAHAGPSSPMSPGNLHLNVAVGRFGLYLTGPDRFTEEMHKLAAAIVTAN